MIELLKSGTTKQQLEITTCFRKLLSDESSSTIDKVNDQINSAGLVSKFVEFLQRDDYDLQSEAAWVLSNIAAGNSLQTKRVVDTGALPVLVELLSSPSENVQELAACCLGNIASNDPECRDLLLDHIIFSPLLQYVF